LTPRKGDSARLPTLPCQPIRALVMPGPHESTTYGGELASSANRLELRV
jgi:hypothetical protein